MATEGTIARAFADAQQGRMQQAIASLRLLLKVRPDDLEALSLLGYLMIQSGNPQQAIATLNRAAAKHPGAAMAHTNLANALLGVERHEEAHRHYDRALQIDPNHKQALLGLCLVLTRLQRADDAVAAADRGLRLSPDWPEMHLNRMLALTAADRVEESIASIRQGLDASPGHAVLLGQLAFLLNYTMRSPEEILEAHRDYQRAVVGTPSPPPCDGDAERPLRIGIMSGDLRSHSVGYFADAFMRALPDGWTQTVFATIATNREDAAAARFIGMADAWVEAAAFDDATLDKAIRDARIDVLVELHGHSSGNRLGALDRKPAPVIVTAIGYPNTTGHPCIDWRIVDSETDPPGAEQFCTERLLRVDPCFLCYSPPAQAAEPAMPDAGLPVTFGSFNLASKIRDESVALWAQAISGVPGSRLLLKSKSIEDPALRARLVKRLAAGGIQEDRIDIVGYTKTAAEHLTLYSRVHVALDTVPYNGTTTTCEALWMGVPVVTIEGDRHPARVGTSLLRAAGLPELVARTPEEFASTAAALATDRARLESLRHGLRDRLRASALMDGNAYAARFHAALRHAWRDRCMKGNG